MIPGGTSDNHSPPVAEAAAEVFAIRAMLESDLPFVRDSWLRSAWGQEARKLRAKGVKARERVQAGRSWFDSVRPAVTEILAAPSVVVIVACCREDRAHIAGWLALRDREPVRSYVKQVYRPWDVEGLLRRAAVEEL